MFDRIPMPERRHGRFRERNCSVGRTVGLIGDGWTFLLLRESFYGVRRFEDFQRVLGIPRATLIQRLRYLLEHELLRRVQYSVRPPRYEYRLTQRGFDLFPVMIALKRFGDEWLSTGRPQVSLWHRRCGKSFKPYVGCSSCDGAVTPRRVRYRNGPGAGLSPVLRPLNSRRSMDLASLQQMRPSAVARALDMIGDRWSFMVMREAWFGARRFDQFIEHLGISPAILTQRLNRFVDLGVFERVAHAVRSGRHEYAITPLGDSLYGPFLAMFRWGDRWLSDEQPPLILKHLDCGDDFDPAVLCDQCRAPLQADEVEYVLCYSPPAGLPLSPHCRAVRAPTAKSGR
jgi:DNA-binding HxlR family transcriptional regulator